MLDHPRFGADAKTEALDTHNRLELKFARLYRTPVFDA